MGFGAADTLSPEHRTPYLRPVVKLEILNIRAMHT